MSIFLVGPEDIDPRVPRKDFNRGHSRSLKQKPVSVWNVALLSVALFLAHLASDATRQYYHFG